MGRSFRPSSLVTAPASELLAELTPIMQRVVAESPKMLRRVDRGGGHAARGAVRESAFDLLVLLAGVFALVVIACANLANLTLAQVMSHRAEHALRAALGGSRAAIVRLQLIETLVFDRGRDRGWTAAWRVDAAGAAVARSDDQPRVGGCDD